MIHALAASGRPDDARRSAKHDLQLAADDSFHRAMCEALVARMSCEFGEFDRAAAHLEAIAHASRPLADPA